MIISTPNGGLFTGRWYLGVVDHIVTIHAKPERNQICWYTFLITPTRLLNLFVVQRAVAPEVPDTFLGVNTATDCAHTEIPQLLL
jgi:hypothetical protein